MPLDFTSPRQPRVNEPSSASNHERAPQCASLATKTHSNPRTFAAFTPPAKAPATQVASPAPPWTANESPPLSSWRRSGARERKHREGTAEAAPSRCAVCCPQGRLVWDWQAYLLTVAMNATETLDRGERPVVEVGTRLRLIEVASAARPIERDVRVGRI